MNDYYCIKFAKGDKMIIPSATGTVHNRASEGKVWLYTGPAIWELDTGSEVFSVEFAADAIRWMNNTYWPDADMIWTVGQEGTPQ